MGTWWLNRAAGETPSQRRLAEHAGTDPMMTSQVLRTLQAKQLITREPDPTDSRTRRVRVTRRGATLAQKAITVVETADANFFEPAGGRNTLLNILRHLAEA